MAELEKILIDAMNKLSEKMDGYDKHFSTIGFDISKVQSQVDMVMQSIQILQKEQVLLVKSIADGEGSSASTNSVGVMGTALASAPSASSLAVLPHQPQSGDHTASLPLHGHPTHGEHDSDQRHLWMPKMDFPIFDGSDVRVWLDKCASYFHCMAYHLIFVLWLHLYIWWVMHHTGFSLISMLLVHTHGNISWWLSHMSLR
jgi:hypothetical protein